MNASALSIRDLTIEIGRHLVKGVSLELKPERIHGLAGESGSGMTLPPSMSLSPRRRIGDQIPYDIAIARARGAAGSTVEEWSERGVLPVNVRTRFPHQFSGGQ